MYVIYINIYCKLHFNKTYYLQLCELYGLLHESKGEGKDRYIEVRKTVDGSFHHKSTLAEEQNPSCKGCEFIIFSHHFTCFPQNASCHVTSRRKKM